MTLVKRVELLHLVDNRLLGCSGARFVKSTCCGHRADCSIDDRSVNNLAKAARWAYECASARLGELGSVGAASVNGMTNGSMMMMVLVLGTASGCCLTVAIAFLSAVCDGYSGHS